MNVLLRLSVIFFLVLTLSTEVYAGPQRLCQKSDGSFVVKRRCKAKRGETQLSIDVLGSSLVQAGAAGPQGPAGANGKDGVSGLDGVDGVDGATGPQGPSGVVNTSIVSQQATLTTSVESFSKLGTIGTFTKINQNSLIKITLNTHGSLAAHALGGAYFCNVQIRVDELDTLGNPPMTFTSEAGGTSTLRTTIANDVVNAPLSATALFTSLDAGLHTVNIYARLRGTSCHLSAGGYFIHALVEEYMPG